MNTELITSLKSKAETFRERAATKPRITLQEERNFENINGLIDAFIQAAEQWEGITDAQLYQMIHTIESIERQLFKEQIAA